MIRRILLLLCLLLTASCIESQNPVSDPNKALPEKKLIGLWKAQNENGEIIFVHFGLPQGKLGEHYVYSMQVNHDRDRGLWSKGTEWRLIFSSNLGKQTYLNTVQMTPETIHNLESAGWRPAPETKYDIFRYELSGNTLKILVPDQGVLKQAVEQKKLKGEVQKLGGVRLMDSTENLAKFLANEKTLYSSNSKPMVFTRVK